jgi:AcrR family transcriptional regulator
MGTTPSAQPGLRERKKQETRRALSWAAVRLAVERGLGNVLVEDIAAEVGVSPRTFNNYFSSKAEAICARHLDRVRRVAEALRDRPADEPLWDAVTHAVLSQFGDEERVPDPAWTAGVRLMVTEPALQGEMLRASAIAEREFAQVIAERTGTDIERDLYPLLMAGAVGSATQAAMDRWLHADPPVPVTPLVREALALLAAGLPAPPTTS